MDFLICCIRPAINSSPAAFFPKLPRLAFPIARLDAAVQQAAEKGIFPASSLSLISPKKEDLRQAARFPPRVLRASLIEELAAHLSQPPGGGFQQDIWTRRKATL
jgi:hypothetical protein